MHKQWAAQEQRLVATVQDGDSQQFSPENQHCHHGGSLCFTMSCTTSEVDEQQIYHVVLSGAEGTDSDSIHLITAGEATQGTAPQVSPEVWVVLQSTKETG